MTISALPAVPTRSMAPDAFVTAADAFMAALPTFVNELNAMGTALNLATTSTSVTSNTIGTGSKTFTVATGLGYVVGMSVSIAYTTTPTNNMFGTVTAYNSGTGSLTVNVTTSAGSGTFTAWTIALAAAAVGAGLGSNTYTGAQNFAYGTDIAAAATINLTTATGNTVNITGTGVTITTVTLGAGMWRLVKFTGANTLAYHATTNNLNSNGQNIPTTAGDSCFYYSDGTTVTGLYFKASGLPNTLQVTGGVRQTVQAAPVDTSGLPNYLPATSSGTTLTATGISATVPFVVNAAGGGGATGLADRVGVSTSNLAWTGLTITNTVKNYGYVDTAANGTLTTGVGTLAPIYQQGGTPSTTNGQYTFNYGEMRGYLGNGTTAPQVYRTYVWEGTGNGTNVASIVAYALNGFYDSGFTATLPAAGTLTSRNHNIGTAEINGFFVRECTTTDLGYAVGDRIISVPGGFESSNYHPDNINTTALTISLSKAGNYYSSNRSGAAGGSLTVGSWKYKFIAKRIF